MGKFQDSLTPYATLEERASDGSDITNPAADHRRLFLGEDGLLHLRDSAGAVTTPGSGIADQGAFTYLDATEAAAPSTPASGKVRVYAKSDGRIYSKDDGGVEYGPFDAAGGAGGPLLFADGIALHADGDDFASDAMTGWTLSGLTAPTDFTEITTELYDATCLDVVFSAQGDRFYKTIDPGDWTYYLSLHGVTNGTPNSLATLGGMIALVATDDAGTGTGMSLYSDQNGYMWGVSSHIYSATGNVIVSGWNAIIPATATNWPIIYRLSKSGTTITGGISFNGGASYKTNTRTDSTTFTRIGVTRLFTDGGTNPVMRVGRFNLVP